MDAITAVNTSPQAAGTVEGKAVKPRHDKRDWRGWKFMWPFALVFVFVFVIPLIYAVYISFFQQKMIGGNVFVGFENYLTLFRDGQFWSSVGRVALFTVVQVPIMLVISAVFALLIDSAKLHGMKFFRVTTFMPYAIPAVVAALMWGFMYGAKYGLLGSVNSWFGWQLDFLTPNVILAAIGNIVTWEFAGYNMLIFYASLTTIPHSWYEAAAIDGASEWRIVRSIKIPQMSSALAITVIFSIIGSFQLFNEPSVLQSMTTGNVITTYFTPNLYAYNLAFNGGQSNYSATLAIVMAIITMVIAYVVQLRSMREEMN